MIAAVACVISLFALLHRNMKSRRSP